MATGGIPIETLDVPRPATSRLTGEEIERLKRFSARSRWWRELPVALGNGIVPGLLVFVVTWGLWRWLAPVDNPWKHLHYFEALGVAVGLWVALFFIRDAFASRQRCRKQATLLGRDVADRVGKVLDLDIARAVEIEEFEDEGAGFFLELTDGRVLCLISQDLYDYASDVELQESEQDRREEFPQTRIRYRFAPHSGHCLHLVGIGEPLRPFGKVKTTGRFFKKDKQTGQRSYTGPEDGMVYEGPLEATLADFRYKLKPL